MLNISIFYFITNDILDSKIKMDDLNEIYSEQNIDNDKFDVDNRIKMKLFLNAM